MNIIKQIVFKKYQKENLFYRRKSILKIKTGKITSNQKASKHEKTSQKNTEKQEKKLKTNPKRRNIFSFPN
jgi:hypothetical protein